MPDQDFGGGWGYQGQRDNVSDNSGNAPGGGGGIRDIDTSQAAARQEADRYSNNEATQAQNNAMAQAQSNAQAQTEQQARQEQIARDAVTPVNNPYYNGGGPGTSFVSTPEPTNNPYYNGGGPGTSFVSTPTPEQPAQLETPAVPRVDLPFFAKYQMDPASLGMPLILSGVAAGFAPTTTPSPGGYSFYNPSSGAIPSPAYSGSPYTPTPLGQNLGLGNDVIRTDNSGNPVFTGGKGITPTISSDIKYPSYLSGVAKIESSLNPLAKSTTSTASGLFGFLDKTFTDTLSKMGYDTSTLTKDQLDALKSNPQVSAKVAEAFTNQNVAALSYADLDASDPAHLYAAHLLGPTLAIKALMADPNTPISDIATARQIGANPKLLGGDKTVGDVLGNLGDKINSAISSSGNFVGNIFNNTTSTASDVLNAAVNAPSNFADTLGSILNGTFTPTSETSNPVPPVSINVTDVTKDDIRNALYGGLKSSEEARASGNQTRFSGVAALAQDLNVPGATRFVGSGDAETPISTDTTTEEATKVLGGAPGGNPNAADITPSGEIDWSKGNLPFVDNTKAKEELYNQPNPNFPDDPSIANSVTGDTPETYAQKFLNGDVSQVQSRISYVNGFPQVEFFAKGLDQVGGEILSGIASAPGALISAVGNIFNPTPSDTAKAAQSNPATFSDWLSSVLNGKPTSSDNGFRSSQTQPTPAPVAFQGRGDQPNFGGSSPVAQVPVPQPVTVAAADTIPVTQNNVNTTGMNLARRPYVRNPTVATSSVAYPNYQPTSRFS
jgi:hypothetical protein